MKTIVAATFAVSLAACSHAPITPSASSFSGHWYSVRVINDTDYRTDDCSYEDDGTFVCKVVDRGCAGGVCEAQSFTFSGTWELAGSKLTRRTAAGFLSAKTTEWAIEQQTGEELLLQGEERWFRSWKARDRIVSGAR